MKNREQQREENAPHRGENAGRGNLELGGSHRWAVFAVGGWSHNHTQKEGREQRVESREQREKRLK